ncbi:MAG TPA: glycoside hydrolase family 2 protein [Dysgonamonadaceae bacterium]|nr:glycoside hydrolase family 2 protein [Dysgonamonadaceae bacterium]
MEKIFVLLCLIPAFLMANKPSKTLQLNEDWQFSQSNKDEWHEATIPGSVQQDLIRLNILPDPYFGTNEEKVQWVEDENWDFKKSFQLTAKDLQHDDALLTFEGLDTYADVYLNGSKLFHADNMFLKYEKSVKNLLREGENNLYIRFYSPIDYLMPARLTNGFEYPAANDHRNEKVSVYARKAPYHFGWDWGMRLVQMGIWRPVSITFYNKSRIEDFFVEQKIVSEELVEITNNVEVFSLSDNPTKAQIRINYSIGNEKPQTHETTVSLTKGSNKVLLDMEIPNPKLWMPNSWGEQHLYDFTAQVVVDNEIIAQKSHRIGLRNIRVVHEDDTKGRSFYFEVNGKPMFAKGANYIPGEIMNTLQDDDYYERLYENVTAANMNMIRVWGGGFYENKKFYELADEKGVLVWQDFMFGCTPYPHDEAFLSNVAREAEYNVKLLRNHPSIAIWCGNNEVEESIKYWGFDKIYSKEIMKGFREGYDKTFRELLPDIVMRLDPQTFYLHGSPDTANWGRKESLNYGDAHYWGVWHGREPFEVLDENVPRFMSEFGFQSFPEMKTIRTFAEPKDFSIDSEVMKTHQKSGIGNEAIKQYMDMYYNTPSNFEDFVYVGLVMQGEGMKYGLEAHRRNRPFCMGTLYWQLNDSWPVVSWSGIDYYNNWKALHFKARDVFAPIAINVHKNNDTLDFHILSDELTDRNNLKLTISLINFTGKKEKNIQTQVMAKANASEKIHSLSISDFASLAQQENCVVHVSLTDQKNKVITETNYYFNWPNKLNLPKTQIEESLTYADGEYTIILSSKNLAKDVFVEIPILGAKFSDNFFDLLPGKKKVITILSPELKKSDKTNITVKHLRQTYK